MADAGHGAVLIQDLQRIASHVAIHAELVDVGHETYHVQDAQRVAMYVAIKAEVGHDVDHVRETYNVPGRNLLVVKQMALVCTIKGLDKNTIPRSEDVLVALASF